MHGLRLAGQKRGCSAGQMGSKKIATKTVAQLNSRKCLSAAQNRDYGLNQITFILLLFKP
jgi:hypothetical protein